MVLEVKEFLLYFELWHSFRSAEGNDLCSLVDGIMGNILNLGQRFRRCCLCTFGGVHFCEIMWIGTAMVQKMSLKDFSYF